MVKKLQKISTDKKKSGVLLSSAVNDSAQQIWLAGLGAFSKAQMEGGKVFDSLVKEGLSMQRKTQTAAEEKINEATSRMTSMANDIGSRAAGKWDKLETIFEDRVAKAMSTLGVPSAHDVQALSARISALEKSLGKTASAAKTPAKSTGNGATPAAVKPAAKTRARKAATPAAAEKPMAKTAVKKPAAKRAPRTAAPTPAAEAAEATASSNAT